MKLIFSVSELEGISLGVSIAVILLLSISYIMLFSVWHFYYKKCIIKGLEDVNFKKELAKEYNQIPSYTLIRNTYKWFSRYETITYLEGKQNKNEVIQKFKEFKNKDNLMNYLNELVSEVIFNEDRTLEIRFNFKLN